MKHDCWIVTGNRGDYLVCCVCAGPLERFTSRPEALEAIRRHLVDGKVGPWPIAGVVYASYPQGKR